MSYTYTLGIDCSTQGMKAILLDVNERRIINQIELNYSKDERLNRFGINFKEYIVPPREFGEAEQPPLMYLAALDAVLSDLKDSGCPMDKICIISLSAQQHGHVYLSKEADTLFSCLKKKESARNSLVDLLQDVFSYGLSPIWKTANTQKEADHIRSRIGGSERMISLSGSDSPLKFTGAIIRRIGLRYPALYAETSRILLTNSFLSGVLTGDCNIPVDFGNGSGMSLMDYQRKVWSGELIDAVSEGLPGGGNRLQSMLTHVVAPYDIVGKVSSYFQEKYNLGEHCLVTAGSGDNPQTKVLVKGDLLSIGTSIVIMAPTENISNITGDSLGMYDGTGNPFRFGGRHNGAMIWDFIRKRYNIFDDDFGTETKVLAKSEPGSGIFLWQPYDEAFPVSSAFEEERIGYSVKSFENDYPALIDSSLAIVHHYSKVFTRDEKDPLYITGGACRNKEILKRVAAIWNRDVIPIDSVGAALGAAVSGAVAYGNVKNLTVDPYKISEGIISSGMVIKPDDEYVKKYKEYLPRVIKEFERLIYRN